MTPNEIKKNRNDIIKSACKIYLILLCPITIFTYVLNGGWTFFLVTSGIYLLGIILTVIAIFKEENLI